MSEEFYIETLENIKEYMQNSIDKGYHKFIYNDLDWDVKCIDVISAIDMLIDKNKELEKIILEFANDRERILKTPVISKDKIKEKLDKKREEIKENCLINGLSPEKGIYKKNVQIAMIDTIKKELLEGDD